MYSESNFNSNVRHNSTYKVVGMCGINTKYHDAGITVRDNIRAGARELRSNLNRCNGDYLKAIWLYKGYSSLGLRQARYVGDIHGKLFRTYK